MLHKKDLSRIKEVWYCAEEDKPVDRDEIVKGFEVSKGEYVVVENSELKSIAPPTAQVMEILQFVRANEVDPIFLESSYYVAPEEAVTKPYKLLLTAMTETKYYAVAKVTMHSREHIVVIRPAANGLVLHTMYYVGELHQANSPAKQAKAEFSAKEMDLSKKLIETLASPFKPEQYEDQYRKNVERLIEQKHQGKKPTSVKMPRMAPVVNILDALQRSLRQTSKANTAPAAKPPAPRGAAKKKAKKRSGKAA